MNALVTVVLSSNQFSQLPLTRLVPAVSSFISLIYEFPRTRANLDLMGRLLTTLNGRGTMNEATCVAIKEEEQTRNDSTTSSRR